MVAAPVDYFFTAKGVRLEPRKLDLLRFDKVSEQQAIHEILHSNLKVEGAAKLHANARTGSKLSCHHTKIECHVSLD